MWHYGGECSSAKATHVRLQPEAFAPVNRTPSCPVIVSYEPAPTGFGLVCLGAAGIKCVVAAPSKLQRPSRMTLICAGRLVSRQLAQNERTAVAWRNNVGINENRHQRART
jgi:hypothetical protein